MAGEEVEEFFVSSLDLGNFIWVGGDDFIDDGVDGSSVGGLEAHFFCQGGGVLFGSFPKGGEEVFCLGVGDGASFDEVEDFGEFFWGDGGVLDLDGLLVEEA